jgi:hypothetical protein
MEQQPERLGPRHAAEGPTRLERLRKELEKIDAKIVRSIEYRTKAEGDARAAAVDLHRGRAKNGRAVTGHRALVKKWAGELEDLQATRAEIVREIDHEVAEEGRRQLVEEANEAHRYADALARKGEEVDAVFRAALVAYTEFKSDIETARRRGWVTPAAAVTLCGRAFMTKFAPVSEFSLRPVPFEERKTFGEIGASLGNACRGASLRIARKFNGNGKAT